MPSKKSSRRQGESANHLVSFQYRELSHVVSPGVSPGLPATVVTGGVPRRHQRAAPIDAERAKLAFRIQSFHHVLFPDAVDAAVASVAGFREAPAEGAARTAGAGGRGAVLLPTPSGGGAQVQTGRTIAKQLLDFDGIVGWEYVYAVVLRGQDPDVDFQCPICLESSPCAPRMTPCGHVFCMPCILRFLKTQKEGMQQRTCPMCHALLVPSMLKRCLLQHVQPTVREGEERTFVLVQRDARSPLVYAATDAHLLDAVQHNRSENGLLVVPRAEDDASWRYCRYSLATQELHELHQVLDRSALEERRLMLSSSSALPLTHDEYCELAAVDEAITVVDRCVLQCCSSKPEGATPSSSTAAGDALPSRPSLSSSSLAAPLLHHLYVDAEGQQVYLHFVCVKMLHDDCESRGVPMPTTIKARILDVEPMTQTEQTRSVLKPLAFVPLGGRATTCFADMKPLVSKHTMRAFSEVIERRMSRIREDKRRSDEQCKRASTVDDAWEKHKEQARLRDPLWRNAPDAGPAGVSPTMQAFAMPLDEMPTLMELPPSCDTASSTSASRGGCGPSDSSVETRQRATKGRGEDISAALTAANLASATTVKSAWGPPAGDAAVGQGAAQLLFKAPSSSSSQIPVAPSWGGTPFVDRTAKGFVAQYHANPASRTLNMDRVNSNDYNDDDALDPFEQLRDLQVAGGSARRGGASKKKRGVTVSIAGTQSSPVTKTEVNKPQATGNS